MMLEYLPPVMQLVNLFFSYSFLQVGHKILQVIHLLELTDVQDKYWYYLERNMNEQNCLQIHLMPTSTTVNG